MNLVWTILIIFSLILLMFSSPAAAIGVLVGSAKSALEMCFSLCAVYCVWLGLFNILRELGAINAFARLLQPLVTKLYGRVNAAAQGYIALNLSANLLGVSNAATPSALKALEQIAADPAASPNAAIMLFVINAASVQLLPTTVMGMRAAAGSQSPADIVLPTFLATLAGAAFSIFAAKLFYRDKKRPQNAAANAANAAKISPAPPAAIRLPPLKK